MAEATGALSHGFQKCLGKPRALARMLFVGYSERCSLDIPSAVRWIFRAPFVGHSRGPLVCYPFWSLRSAWGIPHSVPTYLIFLYLTYRLISYPARVRGPPLRGIALPRLLLIPLPPICSWGRCERLTRFHLSSSSIPREPVRCEKDKKKSRVGRRVSYML